MVIGELMAQGDGGLVEMREGKGRGGGGERVVRELGVGRVSGRYC